MAFDAGMLACVIHELKTESLGARVEKVYQPQADEILIQIRSREGGRKLLINAGSNNPRIGFSFTAKENPPVPPMFCLFLRKHLQGAKLSAVEQEGFERVVRMEFETRDELGFACKRMLYAEIMGKYSNLIFTDGDGKVMSSLKTVDFSTSSLRQVLPGMRYELPPAQDKHNPLETSEEEFRALYAEAGEEMRCDKWITATYMGISATVAREMAYRATRHVDTPIRYCSWDYLWREFSAVVNMIRGGTYRPTLISEGDRPVEYAFMELTQYGKTEGMEAKHFDSPGAMLDAFFDNRDREQRVRQRASDVLHILTNTEQRLRKKMELQRGELAECEQGELFKKQGDLITANLYQLKKGMKQATLIDYEDYREDGSYGEVTVELDERLHPAANAQRLYKKYNKAKNARVMLTEQLRRGEDELNYIYTVFDALTHAETASDLAEIRDELYRSGYASRMKSYTQQKQKTPTVAQFVTDGGYTVLCGKNNVQNEYITHKLAEKTDYWFHVKGQPGSHVLMVCHGSEPGEKDFTQAAEIAAYYSKAAGAPLTAVDYTFARHVKKPSGGKPGLVIYHTNWTAYVSPRAEDIQKMRVK